MTLFVYYDIIKNMINIEILNQYNKEGKLEKQVHPTLPLIVWNYSRKLQFLNDWDDVSIKARGLVTDTEGVCINNPMPKFFNYSEPKGKYACSFKKPFKVYTKYDGSLILVFWYKDELIVMTKGSFTSTQASQAKELLKDIPESYFLKGLTYSFEYTGPKNRIVNSYSECKLTLLSIRDMQGNELELISGVFDVAESHKLDIKEFKDLKKIAELNIPNEEGYILMFENGARVKVKFEEYVRLHKIITKISTKSIWEYLKSGKSLGEFIKDIPDEMYDSINKVINNLRYNYFQISERVGKVYDYKMYGKYGDKEPITDRKEFADWVKEQEEWMRPILFHMFDNKPSSDIIWKMVEPEFRVL